MLCHYPNKSCQQPSLPLCCAKQLPVVKGSWPYGRGTMLPVLWFLRGLWFSEKGSLVPSELHSPPWPGEMNAHGFQYAARCPSVSKAHGESCIHLLLLTALLSSPGSGTVSSGQIKCDFQKSVQWTSWRAHTV